MVKFYDVSMSIREGIIVYPGNPQPSIQRYSPIPRDKVNESLITLGSHTGTHVDSKLHIKSNADGVEALPLDGFYGKCMAIHADDFSMFCAENSSVMVERYFAQA